MKSVREIGPEPRAMKIIMTKTHKEAIAWIDEWMRIIKWIGATDRIWYWGRVEFFIKNFKV